MWPIFLYMTKDECLRNLRQLELDAYSLLVSALRAQGPLTQEKRRLLKDACKLLNINIDRHKCEVRRAVNDERLNTIAYHMNGPGIPMEDWCQEGRRVLPMLQRISPQTLHPIISDNLAGVPIVQQNYQEMPQSSTFDRKKILATEVPEILVEQQQSYEPNSFENAGEDNEMTHDLDSEPALLQKSLVTKPRVYRPATNQVPTALESEKIDKTYQVNPAKKVINKNQKLMIVSNAESIPTNSILQKTLSVPIGKVTKLNLEKFKIVPSSFATTLQVSSGANTHTANKNFFTNKTAKKIIPLSQLQMLNHKLSSKGGIKVLPINSKIFGKNITMTRITNQQGLKTSILQPFLPNNGGSSTPGSKIKVETIEVLQEIPTEVNDEITGNSVAEDNGNKSLNNNDDDVNELKCQKMEEDNYQAKSENSVESNVILNSENEINSEITKHNKAISEEAPQDDSTKADNNQSEEKMNVVEQDDLASLMQIDSSEFIEPELKESLVSKKDA